MIWEPFVGGVLADEQDSGRGDATSVRPEVDGTGNVDVTGCGRIVGVRVEVDIAGQAVVEPPAEAALGLAARRVLGQAGAVSSSSRWRLGLRGRHREMPHNP